MSAFLARAGWPDAARAPVAGDASARTYARLTAPDGRTAILMEDPGGAEPVRRFAAVARRLRAAGLRPPEVHAMDPEAGLMLLEDLGDVTMAARLDVAPEEAPALYSAGVEMLLALRAAPADGLPPFGPGEMAAAADLAWTDWSAGAGAAPWHVALRAALSAHAGGPPVPILRDCHAENLMWQGGALRVIDFQDAMAGPDGYDLISLLQDARRDVPAPAAEAALVRWRTVTGDGDLGARLAAIGAQRALRILGVFGRLARAGRPGYLRHAPRVRAHLAANLAHPALAPLATALEGRVPGGPAP